MSARAPWSQEQTDRVVEGIVIGAGIALLTELVKLAVEHYKRATEPKPTKGSGS